LCDKGFDNYVNDADNDILSNDIPEMNYDDNSSEDSSEELVENSLEIGNRMSTPSCALCEFAMNILEKQILTNRTLDMVERSVLMICAYMPESIAEPCEEYVQEYGDEIIKAIVEMEMDPDQVCAQLGLCSTTNIQRATGQRCAWGREYWCQSLIHAKACGKVDIIYGVRRPVPTVDLITVIDCSTCFCVNKGLAPILTPPSTSLTGGSLNISRRAQSELSTNLIRVHFHFNNSFDNLVAIFLHILLTWLGNRFWHICTDHEYRPLYHIQGSVRQNLFFKYVHGKFA
jgi:hypothetical protein